MKKKIIAISSIIVACSLLVGCIVEPGPGPGPRYYRGGYCSWHPCYR